MKLNVIYHDNCPDGFTAAWAAYVAYPNANFIPAKYGDPPPSITPGESVIIVDFSYSPDIVRQLRRDAPVFALLDHHQSALTLQDEPGCIIDQSHSGAYLSWRYFHPNTPIPPLVSFVQDRDLWKWELSDSKEINAAIGSYPRTFHDWSSLANRLYTIAGYGELMHEGAAILRYQAQLVQQIAANAAIEPIGSYQVPVVNSPVLQSELGHVLSESYPFAAVYYRKGQQLEYSLRSADNGLDVAKIAETFGGGGHPHAAGFRIAPLYS